MNARERLLAQALVAPGEAARIAERDPASTGIPEFADFAQDELEQRAKDAIARGIAELSEAQELLWASDRYAVLVVLQALDAAGKDSVIKHVMSGVNPQGVHVVSSRSPPRRSSTTTSSGASRKPSPSVAASASSTDRTTKRSSR